MIFQSKELFSLEFPCHTIEFRSLQRKTQKSSKNEHLVQLSSPSNSHKLKLEQNRTNQAMKITNQKLKMKLRAASAAVALASFTLSDAQCLTSYSLDTRSCSYDALISSLQAELDSVNCSHDAATELQLTIGDSEEEVKSSIADACAESYLHFGAITGEGDIFDKEYYDGGTYYNEERESIDENGITIHRLASHPGERIKNIYKDLSQNRGITFPDNLINFESCELNAAMCCFVQDRQAGDNNGNCNTPYDENCVDANPADNVDICYVDMARAPTSSRTTDGFAIFDGEDEDDSHCHGFAWAEDDTDPSARFRGNNLFYVSMYDHFTQRGYVRNVPGAPMCACVEQMPVVTRADCTQIDIVNEDVTFEYDEGSGLAAEVSNLEIEFNACQGANNNNNDLGAYYERLVNEDKISEDKQESFEEIVVGEYYCREAIDKFLDEEGLAAKPACKYGYPSECGCQGVNQQDYRGDIAVTKSGLECQRWDSQSPHSHSRTRKNYPDAGLSENYCRNPDNEPGGAWCYTTDPNKRWEYCDVPKCGQIAVPSDLSTLTLPPTTTSQTVHGICVANASFAAATSNRSNLSYTIIDPFSGTPNAWDDRSYIIEGQENTPCADGIFLKPSLHKSIGRGTSITVQASKGATVCVFMEGNNRNGGWPTSLVRKGFTDYGVQDDFTWSAPNNPGKWTLLCKELDEERRQLRG